MNVAGTKRYNLKKLELRSSKLISGDLLGKYRSAFRGTGVEFADLREYNPGDDVKHIHWKATARSNTAYVKSYEEERQLRVLLAVDTSASLKTPGEGYSWSLAAEFASLIGALTLKANDLLGVMTFSDDVEAFIQPKSGPKSYARVLSALLTESSSKPAGTNLANAMNHLSDTLKKPTIVFIISDFAFDYPTEIIQRISARHDLIHVQITPTAPSDVPLGIMRCVDPETGTICLIDTSSKASRDAWRSALKQHEKNVEEHARQAGAAHMLIQTDVLQPLLSLMKARRKRIAR